MRREIYILILASAIATSYAQPAFADTTQPTPPPGGGGTDVDSDLMKNLNAERDLQRAEVDKAGENLEKAKKSGDKKTIDDATLKYADEYYDWKNADNAVSAANAYAQKAGTTEVPFQSSNGGQYTAKMVNGKLAYQFDDASTAAVDKYQLNDVSKINNYEESFKNQTAGTAKVMSDSGISQVSADGKTTAAYRATIGDVNNVADGTGVRHVFGNDAAAGTVGSTQINTSNGALNLSNASVWSNGGSISGNSFNVGNDGVPSLSSYTPTTTATAGGTTPNGLVPAAASNTYSWVSNVPAEQIAQVPTGRTQPILPPTRPRRNRSGSH